MDSQLQKSELHHFLQSLHFPEIKLRQETIAPAHKKTFEWIYNEQQESDPHWDSFTEWLRNDQQVYWILGKPGSGKSTLMNFVVQDGRTREILNTMAHSTTLLTFFFWENGVDLQKSQLGLLRSLLYQLLDSLSPETQLSIWSQTIRPSMSTFLTTWTSGRLLHLLGIFIRTIDQHFCLFLDGLDEFQGKPDRVEPIIALLNVFEGHENFKICFSSRPEPDLQDLFQNRPGLTMQALTESDIRRYVEDKLYRNPRTSDLVETASMQPQELIHQVVYRADGIFLWVSLAVQSLLRGIKNGDSWENLHARLQQMPEDIFDLYTHMWKRIAKDHPIYAKQAAFCLRLVESFGPIGFIETAVLTDDELWAKFSNPASTWNVKHMLVRVSLDKLQTRMMTCCAGFLEVRRYDQGYFQVGQSGDLRSFERSTLQLQPDAIAKLVERCRIHSTTDLAFVHRTATEYLRTPNGQALLRACDYSEKELETRLMKAVLISFFLAPPPPISVPSLERFHWALGREKPIKYLPTKILVDLEMVFERLFTWKIWDPQDFIRLAWVSARSAPNIDYARAFLLFDQPEYTQMKISAAGLTQDREYLTELLQSARVSRDPYLYNFPSFPYQSVELLLRLGADPNQPALHFGDRQHVSCWQYFLVCRHVNKQKEPQFSSLVESFLQAGADPQAPITVCFSSKQDSGATNDQADLSTSFTVYKLCPLDLVSWDEGLKDVDWLLQQAGATSSGKKNLFFYPPNVWLVDEAPGLSRGTFNHLADGTRRRHFRDLRIYVGPVKSQTFNNGMDAFHAAGWTDEEIQKEPLLERVWAELQASTSEEEVSSVCSSLQWEEEGKNEETDKETDLIIRTTG